MSMVPLALIPQTGMTREIPEDMGEFLLRVVTLFCDIFPEDIVRNFNWVEDVGHPDYYVLAGDLDERHAIKLTIRSDMSVAVFYVKGAPINELDRVALRNKVWTDFQGWMFKIKTHYDRIINSFQYFRVTRRIALFDPALGASIRFNSGTTVKISMDLKRVSENEEGARWVEPAPDDHTSSIRRAIERGWFERVHWGMDDSR